MTNRGGLRKGGRCVINGYIGRLAHGHPRCHAGSNYVYEHILVAERVLGRLLPLNAVVHHVNGNRTDNRPENLVICEDVLYHNLLHTRQRAFDATGNPTHMKCEICKHWGDPSAMFVRRSRHSAVHGECSAADKRARRRRKRERVAS